VNPKPAARPEPPKRLNSFQILGAVLSAAGGVRGVSKRGSSMADASTGAILGAVLIFLALLGLGLYGFVHAVKSSVAG
jgi:sulfite exporter TauE/SafE